MPPLIENNVEEVPLTPIQKFYSGSNVFVTGGTGFLGELLIEKLLRSCPDIGNIYVLIRPKKNKSTVTRTDEMLDDRVFDRLKTVYPKYKYRIVAIEGDCSLPALGISEQDRQLIVTEVSVVFHVAATVNFDEKMKSAVDINVRGTRDLLRLCKEMTQLKTVVHVSTAFSNCAEDVIEESFYPTPIEYGKLMALTEILDEETLNKITPNILGDLPNTYAFTKAIAEKMVQDEGKNLPVGIYRPSIVISTYKEPLEGWINNMYGPVGVTVGAGTGVIRALHCNSSVNANIVPADMCVNGLIACSWEIDRQYRQHQANTGPEVSPFQIPIYNYESSRDNPLTWREYEQLTARHGMKYPSIHAIWFYSFFLIKNKHLYQLATFLLHFVPAFVIDALLLAIGKKRRFVKIYSKIHRFAAVIAYFSTKNFKFNSRRMRDVISSMSPKDRSLFFCDLKLLDWDDYFDTHFQGIRLYLLKDPISTLSDAKKKWKRLYWCHQIVKLLLFYALVRIVWGLLSYLV